MINTVCCVQNGTVGRIREHPIVRAVRRSGEMIPVTEIHLVVEMLLAESARIKRKQSVTYTKRKADDPMKIALVTGASSGIGREFARQIVKLYRNLDEIWLVARRTERLQELEKEFTVPVRIFDGDLNQDYIYERIEKELERKNAEIRILVNSAGCGLSGCFGEREQDTELRMVKLNCQSLTRMLLLCRPFLGRGSRVINLASAAAFAPQPGFAIYAASKSYVYRLSMAIREEWKPAEIFVTVVCPGPVDTEFFAHSGELLGKSNKVTKVDPKAVARKALLDAVDHRCVSVYGTSMKVARIAGKLLPDVLSAYLMRKLNGI